MPLEAKGVSLIGCIGGARAQPEQSRSQSDRLTGQRVPGQLLVSHPGKLTCWQMH